MANNLKLIRTMRGLSQAKLGEMAGTSGQQIQRLENGQRGFSKDWMERLAPHLGVKPIDLIDDDFAKRHTPSSKATARDEDRSAEYRAPPNAAQPELLAVSRTDLPILGAGVGGDDGGVFIDNGEHFGYTARPHKLTGVRGAYAIYVVGDSMQNRYYHGELLHVHPFRPVNRDCFVVVTLMPDPGSNDREYLVKQFVRRNAKELVLRQFNPEAELRFPAAKVLSVHRVVGMAEES